MRRYTNTIVVVVVVYVVAVVHYVNLFIYFPDLQFALTSCQDSAKAEKELRDQVQQLQSDAAKRTEREVELVKRLEEKTVKSEELEEQLRWKELEWRNQLASKDAKVEQLQRQLAATSEVGKLQGECRRLYEETEAESRHKAEEVARRAKTPSSASVHLKSHSLSESSDDVLSRTQPPLIRSLPSPSSTRSKVFRHKLQKAIRNTSVDKSSSSGVLSHKLDEGTTYSRHYKQSQQQHHQLPADYRARVSTLPPIASARSNSIAVPQGTNGPFPDHGGGSRRASMDGVRLIASAAAGCVGSDDGDEDQVVEMSSLAEADTVDGKGGKTKDSASPAFA